MITGLNLFNYQSHEESHFDFHQGVNVIIGSSDSGKTSIIRAIRLVVWNRPSGNAARSWWGGPTSVEVVVPEGLVTRYKGKLDKYILGISNQKTQKPITFKAFGLTVPEEVSQLLNISNINLQMQLDRPFLLDATPGDVAKHFNKVARLYVIDRSTQNVARWTKELVNDIKYGERQVEKLTKDLSKYDGLDKIEIHLETLENLNKRAKTIRNSIVRLTEHIENYQSINQEIKKKSKILKIEPLINKILDDTNKAIVLDKYILKLGNTLDRINELKEEIKQRQLILIHEEAINNLIELYNRSCELTFNKNRFSRLLDRVKAIERSIKEAEIKHASYVKEFNKAFPDTCPLCGEPHNTKHKH